MHLVGFTIEISVHISFIFLVSKLEYKVSHPYKTVGKIIILYISIFEFLDSRLEDIGLCAEQ